MMLWVMWQAANEHQRCWGLASWVTQRKGCVRDGGFSSVHHFQYSAVFLPIISLFWSHFTGHSHCWDVPSTLPDFQSISCLCDRILKCISVLVTWCCSVGFQSICQGLKSVIIASFGRISLSSRGRANFLCLCFLKGWFRPVWLLCNRLGTSCLL